MSGAEPSQAFELLNTGLQRWMWKQGWKELRPIQEEAAGPILKGIRDVIIAAPTAGGKTEAAFLPILTRLADGSDGHLCVCVSPLKALINDQYHRLLEMGEAAKVPVTRWHGDVPRSEKKKFLDSPRGVLLITPESLEARLVRGGSQAKLILGELADIVVDELHAFIGTERGKQLQSLLNRLELLNRRRVPRIALSATLGSMELAAAYLRPHAKEAAILLKQDGAGRQLQLIQRGYRSRAVSPDSEKDDGGGGGLHEISDHLYGVLRGSHNLVFANSRGRVEEVADFLRRRCEVERVPNEFLPHHGSLSRDLREHAEERLKDKSRPSTLVATTTLEMGIDVGAVRSIAQVGTLPSVASMQQRMGRSGRQEGEPAILRIYIQEDDGRADMSPQDALRAQTVQSIAMVQLMLDGWIEPPAVSTLNLSTLIQQILSLIAQHGGVRASDAWSVLCEHGPFNIADKSLFVALLRSLGHHELVTQTSDGLLVLGERGEKLVEHYDFYAAFFSPDEFQVRYEGRELGALPITQPVVPGSHIILGGSRWEVINTDVEAKVITVRRSRGGSPPRFDGGAALVDDRVRAQMRSVYLSDSEPRFLDRVGQQFLREGRRAFLSYGLKDRNIVSISRGCLFFPWCGTRGMCTLELAFISYGLSVSNEGVSLSVGCTEKELLEVARSLLSDGLPPAPELAARVGNKLLGKYDHYLPDELLDLNYASEIFDVPAAEGALRRAMGDGVQG